MHQYNHRLSVQMENSPVNDLWKPSEKHQLYYYYRLDWLASLKCHVINEINIQLFSYTIIKAGGDEQCLCWIAIVIWNKKQCKHGSISDSGGKVFMLHHFSFKVSTCLFKSRWNVQIVNTIRPILKQWRQQQEWQVVCYIGSLCYWSRTWTGFA